MKMVARFQMQTEYIPYQVRILTIVFHEFLILMELL
jgi:hypothetical protein